MRLFIFALMGIVLLTSGACTQSELAKDSPTMGEISIVADETLRPIVEAEEDIFEHTYPYAKINVKYLPGNQAMNYFLKDSTKIIVAARKLNTKEELYFQKIKITPRHTPIATDAVAFIIHPSNPDTTLTREEILKVLSGDVTQWSALSPNNKPGAITVVFDNQNSSTVQYIREQIKKDQLSPNVYALKDNLSVVDYVAKHPQSVGIIGYSWISDYDDPLTKKMRRETKLLALSPGEKDPRKGFYQPYASYLIDTLYPFRRNIYVISREGRAGLGTGFASFIAGDIGQRIIQKAGIPPYYRVEYNIEIYSKPFKLDK
jgi:phosphate transport system substrate-binding protein